MPSVCPREDALKELGLEGDKLNVFILPGAQNNFDSSAIWSQIFAELTKVPGVNIVFAEWLIADKTGTCAGTCAKDKRIPVLPIVQCFRLRHIGSRVQFLRRTADGRASDDLCAK